MAQHSKDTVDVTRHCRPSCVSARKKKTGETGPERHSRSLEPDLNNVIASAVVLRTVQPKWHPE